MKFEPTAMVGVLVEKTLDLEGEDQCESPSPATD